MIGVVRVVITVVAMGLRLRHRQAARTGDAGLHLRHRLLGATIGHLQHHRPLMGVTVATAGGTNDHLAAVTAGPATKARGHPTEAVVVVVVVVVVTRVTRVGDTR